MSKTKAGPVNSGQLKSFLERIEKLLEERAAIGGDIRDVFAEAKGVGYDVKTMRRLIQVRAMDAADRAEAETLLDTYMHAIGMESSSHTREPTEDELEERAGRIVAEIDRCMALATNGKPPKIEAIKGLIGCSNGKAHKLRGFVAERLSRSNADDRENENAALQAVTLPLTPQTVPGLDTPAVMPAPDDGVGAGTHSESCGGRGVQTTVDNPPPHGFGLQQGQATPSTLASLPLGGTDATRDAGNVAKPETDPGSAPRSPPPQDLFQRITGAFTDIPAGPTEATEAKANHPPQGAASAAAGADDDLAIPAFLDRRQRVPA